VDPEDTIIIRNLYPQMRENEKIFGIKHHKHIKSLFLSLLALLERDVDTIKSKIKYVKKEEFTELDSVISLLKSDIAEWSKMIVEKNNITEIVFENVNNTFVEVKFGKKRGFSWSYVFQ